MYVRQKEMLFKADATYKSMEEVPEWKVRTPLQRAVQLLKRHRDIYFANDHENCPVSIILTTLAAKAYNNQNNIFDAIVDMVRDMPKHIEVRDGKWWVENPVEPGENFADKWNEKPERRNAFLGWLRVVQQDFQNALMSPALKEAGSILRKALEPSETGISKSLGLTTTTQALGTSRVPPQVPDVASTNHVQSLPYPEKLRYNAQISGTVHHPETGKRLWELTKRPVQKGLSLLFVISTKTPSPYTVRWQVVNTGAEAIAAGQLRGGFYDGEASNPNARYERTLYLGTHWVEVFIIKDGICVARSDRKYVKIRG
jgi:Adenylyl/Guanylyl and SMODS C-terminal sensor domain